MHFHTQNWYPLKQEWAMEKDNGFDYNFFMIFRYLLFVVVLQFLTRQVFFCQVGCHWYC